MTWSAGVGNSSKNRSRRSKSVASKAALLRASSSSAVCWRRSGLRPVRTTSAPSARARLAVSSPIPELPPITTTVCPRSWGSRRVGETVLALVMVSSSGHCRRWSLTQRSPYRASASTRTASSGKNLKDLPHVVVGGGCCLLRTAAVLTRDQVGRVPVPPVVLGVRLLVVAVVFLRLAEELCKGCDVYGSCSRRLPFAAGKP